MSLDESDEQDGTPLHYAAKKGFIVLAKLIVGAGGSVDARNAKNMTPLHLVTRIDGCVCNRSVGTERMPYVVANPLSECVYFLQLTALIAWDENNENSGFAGLAAGWNFRMAELNPACRLR